MPRLKDTARVRLKGSTGVDHTSPLEEQCQEVYRVALALATSHGFKPHTYNGPHGPVKGVAGPMVMSRLVRQLLPGFNDTEFKRASGLINQVLRKTDACVCIKQPNRHGGVPRPEDLPVWFIADTMPDNIVVVALSHARNPTDTKTTSFSEDEFLTRRERQLPMSSVGEDQEPAEVTVTTTVPPRPPRPPKESDRGPEQALKEYQEQVRAERDALMQRILDELATSPISLSATDIGRIINRDDGVEWSHSHYRDLLNQLLGSGRVVRRKETDDERRVRGGGDLPKAGRVWLWWLAPGPVPERDRMPAGIAPLRPATDWVRETKDQLEADTSQVMRVFNARPGEPGRGARTINRISEACGLDRKRTREILTRLMEQKVVYQDEHARYYLELKRRRSAPENQPTETEEAALPPETQVDTVDPSLVAEPAQTPLTLPPGDDLQIVLNLASRLGVDLPSGDDARVRELEDTNTAQGQRIDDLVKENEKLRGQVTALKQAIAALD